MKEQVDSGAVGGLFTFGIDAIRVQADLLDDFAWQAPACGEWTSTETARHLLAVSRWYHHWLDRALDGDLTPPFDEIDMDQRNTSELSKLTHLSGPEAVAEFETSARNYLARLAEHWDVPYAYPYGLVTAGLHAGVAATEWHLHAWDLSTVTGRIHHPENARDLFLAAGACVAAAEGGLRGALMAKAAPLVARRRPWHTLVRRSGRTTLA